MSIIYDALKKTQNSRKSLNNSTEGGAAVRRFRLRVDTQVVRVGIAIATLAIIIAAGLSYKQTQNQLAAAKAKVKAEALAEARMRKAMAANVADKNRLPKKPSILSHLVINGIFVSPEYRTALINDQYIAVGDEIEGLKVVEIKIDKVKFFDGKRTWTLKRSV